MDDLKKLTSPSVIRALLNDLGHRPNKGLGQNYLIDSNILDIIVGAADISKNDSVLEIGPGLGALTQALLKKEVKLTAVEKDPTMSAHLRKIFPTLTLLENDILDTDIDELLESGIEKIVANLPYSVGSRFIVNALESKPLPKKMVFLIQKEVADRITAEPGSKSYGPLAIWSQLRYKVRQVKKVSPNCFLPAPKVFSSVVQYTNLDKPLADIENYARFKRLVKLCFNQRRKQIGSNLRKNAPEFLENLETAQIAPQTRPEQISIEQFATLARN